MNKVTVRKTRHEIQKDLHIPTFTNGATRCEQSHRHTCNIWCRRQRKEQHDWAVKVDQIVLLCESPMVKEHRAYCPNYNGMAQEQHELFTKTIRHCIERNNDHKLPVLAASQADIRRFSRPTVSSKNKTWLAKVIEPKSETNGDDRGKTDKNGKTRKTVLKSLEKAHASQSFSKWELKDILAALTAKSNEITTEQDQHDSVMNLKSSTPPSNKNQPQTFSSERLRLILRKDIHARTREDIQIIFKALRSLKAFEKLADVLLMELCSVVTLQEFAQDKIIFKQGDEGSIWYVILSGSVDVMVMNKAVAEYQDTDSHTIVTHGRDLFSIEAQKLRREGQFIVRLVSGQGFGELALINDSKRGASIIAHEPCQLLCIEKRDYNRILRFVHDQEHKEKDMYIRKIPILEGLEEINIFSMADIVGLRCIPAKSFICKEGDLQRDITFICKGSCIVTKTLSFEDPTSKQLVRKNVTLGKFIQGDYFGELALRQLTKDLKPMPSPFTIQALEDTTIMLMTLADARMKLGSLLKPTTISSIAIDQSRLLEKYVENCEEKEWDRFRRKMVDGIIKERFHDPNLTNDKYQYQLEHKPAVFRMK